MPSLALRRSSRSWLILAISAPWHLPLAPLALALAPHVRRDPDVVLGHSEHCGDVGDLEASRSQQGDLRGLFFDALYGEEPKQARDPVKRCGSSVGLSVRLTAPFSRHASAFPSCVSSLG